jgi:thymidylate synthase
MKNLQEYLNKILTDGYQHTDRTGHGRITVPGLQLRWNMAEGFPLVTSKLTRIKPIVRELLWFLKGDTSGKNLEASGCGIWKEWTVRDEHIPPFVDKLAHAIAKETLAGQEIPDNVTLDQEVKNQLVEQLGAHSGTIGPLYGRSWRSLPVKDNGVRSFLVSAHEAYDNLMSDKKALVDKALEAASPGLTPDKLTSRQLHDFMATIPGAREHDQLGELIANLKKRPFSSRLIVSAWIPQWVPDEDFSPVENVLMGYGALSACHCMFQCFVAPPKEEGGKNRLSLLWYQR